MESKLVSFELKDNYLLVVGHGSRDSLIAMNQASTQIFEQLRETGATRLLVDYRMLRINVHLNEAFNIVKRYEVVQPQMRQVKIAAVFDESGVEFGNYWKEIAGQRGFNISIFQDMEAAKNWLNENESSQQHIKA